MKRFDLIIKAKGVFVLLISLFYASSVNAQCSFTGLDPTYCIDDAAVTLTGTPDGGTFSGPGMTGDEFDPAAAGVGVHTITYEIAGGGGDRYYIKSSIGNPWGSTTNNTHMNTAFGGDWTLESFEFCDVATVFSPTTSFVFLDGSDNQATELNTFLTANLPAIEAWVTAGGSILINSAPNEGGDINFGFGGTTLNYVSFEFSVTGVDPAHPVFAGPNLPTTTAMTGTYYSHARILGAGYTNILINLGDVVLCEKAWGAGHVAVGGMTTTNWHNPDPHADNFRANLFVYLDELASVASCTYTQDVEVFDLPAVTATADPTELCEGEDVILTGGGADTYVWDGGVTDGVAFTPPLGTTTYEVTGTNTTTTCVNTATVDVTVNPTPIVTATATPDEICLGESITFTGGGADTYAWDGGVTDGVAFTPAASGTFTYNVTGTIGATGCENTASVDVTVHDLPVVTAAVTDTEICEGEEVTFTGGGADTYTWDGGVTDGVAITLPIGTATYTVTGVNTTTTCENTASVDVTVNPNPVVTATATPDEICLGDDIVFTGGGADTYVWDGGVTDGVAFTPAAEGTFTFTVIGTITATGCQETATVDVSVFDNPVITATATPDEICIGEEITFTGGGADTYVWDGGVTDGVPFTPAAPGTYTFNVTGSIGASGCENTASVDITVHDLPVVTAAVSEIEICEGEEVTFTGGGADTYTWDGGVTDGVAFAPPVGTTTYTVTGVNTTTTCENTATVDVTVNANPVVTASASDDEVCLGESVVFTGGGADAYVWDGGMTDGTPFTPSDLGTFTYTVIGTTAAGCTGEAEVTITVIDCEPVFANFEFDNNLCVGDCITLTDLSEGPVVSYDWTFGGAADPDTSTEPSPTVCFTTVGTFTISLTVTSESGFTSSVSTTLTVNEIPNITVYNDTIIDIGSEATLIVVAPSSGTFTWIPEDGLSCPDCEVTQVSPQNTTTYQVYYIDENGCSDQDSVKVWINYAQGIGVPSGFSPNGDGENDILFVKGFGIEALNFSIFNRYGELVFQSDNQNLGWDGTFKNRDENPGVFTWVVNYTLQDGSYGTLKGNTTLVR